MTYNAYTHHEYKKNGIGGVELYVQYLYVTNHSHFVVTNWLLISVEATFFL